MGTIAVCGATGRQGGSVARRWLAGGGQVRALTRRPDGAPARALAAAGADVVRADMEDPASLRAAFDGVDGVFSVQNGLASGFQKEVLQGRNVAEAAKAAVVAHVVYSSAAIDVAGSGVSSWDSKLVVEAHLEDLGLPLTVLRPTAFMELMTDKAFYPAVGTWRIFPKLTGEHRPMPWVAVEDVGAVAAVVFSRPEDYVGRAVKLSADIKSVDECRLLYREVMGRDPKTFPMPIWLFDRFTRKDITAMWRWCRDGELDLETSETRSIVPTALTVREWLTKQGKAQVP